MVGKFKKVVVVFIIVFVFIIVMVFIFGFIFMKKIVIKMFFVLLEFKEFGVEKYWYFFVLVMNFDMFIDLVFKCNICVLVSFFGMLLGSNVGL